MFNEMDWDPPTSNKYEAYADLFKSHDNKLLELSATNFKKDESAEDFQRRLLGFLYEVLRYCVSDEKPDELEYFPSYRVFDKASELASSDWVKYLLSQQKKYYDQDINLEEFVNKLLQKGKSVAISRRQDLISKVESEKGNFENAILLLINSHYNEQNP